MSSAGDTKTLVEGVRAGDTRALARAITLVEDGDPAAYELVAALYPDTGRAHAIGFTGPPGVGKTALAQALGYEAIKAGFLVLYCSIFDLVRDFLKDEAFNQQDKTLRRYLKPDLLIIDDMGLKALPKHSWRFQKSRAGALV